MRATADTTNPWCDNQARLGVFASHDTFKPSEHGCLRMRPGDNTVFHVHLYIEISFDTTYR